MSDPIRQTTDTLGRSLANPARRRARLQAITDVLADDHARGCAGREYACCCGYDDRMAAEINRLRARLARTRDLLVRLHDGCPALTSEALNLLGAEIDAIDAEAPANG